MVAILVHASLNFWTCENYFPITVSVAGCCDARRPDEVADRAKHVAGFSAIVAAFPANDALMPEDVARIPGDVAKVPVVVAVTPDDVVRGPVGVAEEKEVVAQKRSLSFKAFLPFTRWGSHPNSRFLTKR